MQVLSTNYTDTFLSECMFGSKKDSSSTLAGVGVKINSVRDVKSIRSQLCIMITLCIVRLKKKQDPPLQSLM